MPSIGHNLQPFTDNGDVSIWVRNSRVGGKTLNKHNVWPDLVWSFVMFLLLVFYGHPIPMMILRHLLISTCINCWSPCLELISHLSWCSEDFAPPDWFEDCRDLYVVLSFFLLVYPRLSLLMYWWLFWERLIAQHQFQPSGLSFIHTFSIYPHRLCFSWIDV